MLRVNEIEGTNIIEIEVDGKVTDDELHDAMARFEAAIETHGRIRILEIISAFPSMESAGAWWEDARFSLKHLKEFERAAVVADQKWIQLWTRIVRPFVRTEVRTFHSDQVDEARAWLRERDAA